jgi:hypothetical protein
MVISYARGAPTAPGYGTQVDASNSTSLFSGRNHKLPIPFRDPGVTSSGVQGVAGQIQQGSRANHPQGDQDLPPSNEPPPIQQRNFYTARGQSYILRDARSELLRAPGFVPGVCSYSGSRSEFSLPRGPGTPRSRGKLFIILGNPSGSSLGRPPVGQAAKSDSQPICTGWR